MTRESEEENKDGKSVDDEEGEVENESRVRKKTLLQENLRHTKFP